ncbi:MAG: sigma 54-interacting transcriptional regulator, partial [Pirellulaceae bacterium]|nr:sigma 54-interacting transcriptional regulator [Pirellulaceae bacterium]
EIDVLPLEQQAKLLRVIETGEYEPVGSNETRRSEARLVVASNYNLEELVRAGSFRTDLYYRLNILNFRLLPLRERPWDIEYLARKFALEHSRTHGIPLRTIDEGFLETLRAYHWPGNIREMENVVRRAVLYCQKGVLSVTDLPSSIRCAVSGSRPAFDPTAAAPSAYAAPAAPMAPESRPYEPLPAGMGARVGAGLPAHGPARSASPLHPMHPLQPAMQPLGYGATPFQPAAPYAAPLAESPASAAARLAQATLEARVDVMERRIIEDSLRRNNFRRKETAAELGISRVTLYNKMKKFGLL